MKKQWRCHVAKYLPDQKVTVVTFIKRSKPRGHIRMTLVGRKTHIFKKGRVYAIGYEV